MINHARTLLLNVNGTGVFQDVPGEEFIPANYRNVKLPTSLQRAKAALYGPSPDRYMGNYRTRELMQMLHSTELVDFVTAFDPRITYRFGSDVMDLGTGLDVEQLEGDAVSFQVYGATSQSPTMTLFREWEVSVTDATEVFIRNIRPNSSGQTAEYTSSGNVSSAIPLPDSGLTIKFGTKPYSLITDDLTGTQESDYTAFELGLFNVSVSGTWSGDVTLQRSFDTGDTWEDVEVYTENTEEVVEVADATVRWRFSSDVTGTATVTMSQITSPTHVGCKWRVKLHGRPNSDLGTVLTMTRSLSEQTIIDLFGPRGHNSPEPYGTFYRLWKKHHELPYSLGGLTLALIYRTEELRNGQ